MDKLDEYRDIVEQVLTKHVFNSERYPHLRDRSVFDRRTDNYLVVREGWEESKRTYGVVVHVEIINGKLWIQEDWTEHGVAVDLEAAGVPKTDIVLGFQPPPVRPYTEYAAV
ncbi:MAG: XisI protein [Blastocatellia bacterium]|nr:XisI protein [Blastocatellia bacterium]